MSPPLRSRVGWRRSIAPEMGQLPVRPTTMAGAACLLAAAAAVVGVLALLLPHGWRVDEAGMAGVTAGAAALAAGALVLARRDHLPAWVFHAGALVAAVLATAAIYFWGEGSLYGPLPYLWV